MTAAESALINAVHYGIRVSPAQLARHAAGETYSLGKPNSVEECRAALTACLAKGWLQVIDEAALGRITDELRDGGVVGPIYRLPEVGAVDFTPAGAALWFRLLDGLRASDERCRPAFAYPDVVHSKTARYFRTREAALAEMDKLRGWDEVVSLTGPTPTGPWRVQWWRRFPEGYRLDIETRCQWQGRGGRGESCFMSRTERWRAEPDRLRHLLDCHNVCVGEWLMLAAMDGPCSRWPTHLPRGVSGAAEKDHGLSASEEECRAGLETCLRYRWLRVVDRQTASEVEALLREDVAMSSLPRKVTRRSRGQIDFTPTGAALYRMIAAEYAGPDWEDALSVEREYYREEHRYCESEDSLRRIVKEYAGRGDRIRTGRLVLLGPWCVRWWEWFPRGYRLELEIEVPGFSGCNG